MLGLMACAIPRQLDESILRRQPRRSLQRTSSSGWRVTRGGADVVVRQLWTLPPSVLSANEFRCCGLACGFQSQSRMRLLSLRIANRYHKSKNLKQYFGFYEII